MTCRMFASYKCFVFMGTFTNKVKYTCSQLSRNEINIIFFFNPSSNVCTLRWIERDFNLSFNFNMLSRKST